MRKNEKGVFLIEALVAVALVVVLTALVAQSLPSIYQASNEKNARDGMRAIANAENTYFGLFHAYAANGNTVVLTDCNAPVTDPSTHVVSIPKTATAACLQVSRGYGQAADSGTTLLGYKWDLADLPVAGIDHFVIKAQPSVPGNGRTVYCATDLDNFALHGAVATAEVLSAATDCADMPLVAPAGDSTSQTTSNGTTVMSRMGGPVDLSYVANGVDIANGVMTVATITVPKGSYQLLGTIPLSSNGPGTNNPNAINCAMQDSTTGNVSTQPMVNPQKENTRVIVTFQQLATYASTTTVTLTCQQIQTAYIDIGHVDYAWLSAMKVDTVQ